MSVIVRACGQDADVQVVMLSGRLDMAASEAATPGALAAVEQCKKGLIVDLGGVEFISSAGLRALLSVRKKAEAVGKKMGVVRARPAVYKIFKVSGLDAVFSFFEDEDEALKGLWA